MSALFTTCPTAWGGAPLYWDVNAPLPGAGGPIAMGVWDAGATPNWSPDPDGAVPTGMWAPGATPVFAAGADAVGAYAVTIPPGVMIPGVDGMIFEEGSVILMGGAGSGLIRTAPTITTAAGSSPSLNLSLAGPVGLTKDGAGRLDLPFVNTYLGGTAIDGGVLFVASDDSLGFPGTPLALNGGTLRTANSPSPYARPVTIGPVGGSIDTSGVNPVFTDTLDGPGVLTKIGNGVLGVQHVRSFGLVITTGAVRVLPGGTSGAPAGVSNVTGLSLAGDATPTVTLNITNNGFVVNYPIVSPSPIDDIRDQIVHAYNGGLWNMPGITSTNANAAQFGIGYAESTQIFAAFPAIFLGQVVDPTAVLFRLTRYGDADLSGTVSLPDFNRLAANFGGIGDHIGWAQGDFDYDQLVGLNDFNLMAANFGLSAGADGPTPADWAALAAVVPESATASALLCASGLLPRRRARPRRSRTG